MSFRNALTSHDELSDIHKAKNIFISSHKADLKTSDERIGIMKEVISSIDAIKFLNWEEPYVEKMSTLRREECRHILCLRSG